MQAQTKPVETYEEAFSRLFAELAGRDVRVSLADFDKARMSQSFAKLKESVA